MPGPWPRTRGLVFLHQCRVVLAYLNFSVGPSASWFLDPPLKWSWGQDLRATATSTGTSVVGAMLTGIGSARLQATGAQGDVIARLSHPHPPTSGRLGVSDSSTALRPHIPRPRGRERDANEPTRSLRGRMYGGRSGRAIHAGRLARAIGPKAPTPYV